MSVEDRYYKINHNLLKSIGIWPFEISKWSYIKKIIANSMFLSIIFVQLTVFSTHECTLDIVLKVCSFISPCFLTLLIYNLYYFEMDMIKKVFKNMYYDWMSFKDKAELNIMDHYACTSKLFAEVFLFLVCIATLGIIINNSMPPILDIISPLNESRKQINFIEVEYFVDRFKYQNLIALHLTISVSIAIITLAATGSTLLSIGYHACGMFKVANYRMEITMDEDVLRIHSSQIERLINKRIISAVSVHRRAIQFV